MRGFRGLAWQELHALHDLTPLLLRVATALAFLSVDGRLPGFPPLWPLSLLLLAGLFTSVAAMLGVSMAFYMLAQLPFDLMPYLVLLMCIVPVARRLRLLGAGSVALDPVTRWLPRRKSAKAREPAKAKKPKKRKRNRLIAWLLDYYRDYPSFDLRLSVGFVMMPAGLYFALRPLEAMPWLGALWLALGTLLCLGYASHVVSLASGAAVLLAFAATGSLAWIAVALVAFAAAMAPPDRLTLDHWLATRRGGVGTREGRVALLAERPALKARAIVGERNGNGARHGRAARAQAPPLAAAPKRPAGRLRHP